MDVPFLWFEKFFKTQGCKCFCEASNNTFAPLILFARQMFLKKLQINWRLLYITYKMSVSNWGETRMWGSVLALLQQGTFKQTESELCQVWMWRQCQHLNVSRWCTTRLLSLKFYIFCFGWTWAGGVEGWEVLSDELSSRWNIK